MSDIIPNWGLTVIVGLTLCFQPPCKLLCSGKRFSITCKMTIVQEQLVAYIH